MPVNHLTLLLDRLDQIFQQLLRRMHGELAQKMEKDVTGSQFVVMKTIFEQGQMTVSAVAEALEVSLSAVTALVDRLHRAGYVERSRDENDRRLVWLKVTPAGKEKVGACLAARRQVMRDILGRLPQEDLEELVKIYEKLLSIIQTDGASHTPE